MSIQKSRHGNLFSDTSSARQITPKLLEWAVKAVGAEKILYGTDSPLYFAPMQRCRVDLADIRVAEKRLILRDNAIRLLGLRGFATQAVPRERAGVESRSFTTPLLKPKPHPP